MSGKMTHFYFKIEASLTDQLLQGLTVGDERNNASHHLSSWSGKLALAGTFPFSLHALTWRRQTLAEQSSPLIMSSLLGVVLIWAAMVAKWLRCHCGFEN